MTSFIKTPDHLTVVFDDGETVTVYATNPSYENVLDAVRAKNWEQVRQLAIPAVGLKQKFDDSNLSSRVEITGGVVLFDGIEMHNTLTERMLDMVNDGFDVTPMARFLENLMENPSFRAVNELYGFMEKSKLPITEDGHFVAYKRIRNNYMDIYTGTVDNHIGAIVKMPRNGVDEDKDRTCSSGLHFCAREYLSSYGTGGGHRTVIVKINPRDVVSIPSDYNNAKGRCCRYEVIGELTHSNEEPLEGSYRPEPTPEPVTPEPAPTPDSKPTPTNVNSSPSMRLVQYDLTTGIVIAEYNSAGDAQQQTSVDSSSISKVCRGDRKSAGGYGWRYVMPTSNKPNQPSGWYPNPYEDENNDDEDDIEEF